MNLAGLQILASAILSSIERMGMRDALLLSTMLLLIDIFGGKAIIIPTIPDMQAVLASMTHPILGGHGQRSILLGCGIWAPVI